MGGRLGPLWVVQLGSLSTMSKQPFSFKLPLSRFDVGLLPGDARQIGSDRFKDAVIAHFVAQYAGKGESALVTLDDEEITVLTLPKGQPPFDFVMTMLQSGRLKEAIPYLESMAKTEPGNVDVLYNLGLAYSELGQLDEAIIRLKRAVQLAPAHSRAWTGIGVAYQRMGKPEQALAPLEQAVAADPTDGYGRRNLAAMLMKAGRNTEALAHLRAARQALPHDAQTLFGLAAALESVGGDDNVSEADELYQVVIECWPASPVAEPARAARTALAHKNMRSKVGGGLRPDVMMYIASTLDTFAKLDAAKRRQVTLEIALKGQTGLDINDAEPKYTLKSLPGQYSGMHLISIMYVGMKELDPDMDPGVDLSAEYEAAKIIKEQ
jgi:tetratricopeptide (TPR) repeat protein